jgi:hypothetical protein
VGGCNQTLFKDSEVYTERVQTVMLNHSRQTGNKIFMPLYGVYLLGENLQSYLKSLEV